ncbi:MAG: ATP-dependent helicase, partial [Planctomycetaceae bacterium]
ATEMRDRLSAATGNDRAVREMLLGTFHSIALKILRTDGDKLGYDTSRLTVCSQDDADMLLRQVCEDFGYLKGKTWKAGWSWSKVKDYREEVYTGKDGEEAIPLVGVLAEYHSRLRSMNVLDFGMILLETTRLFAEHPAVLQRWQSRIKHVIVDEYQDTDLTQYILHEFFAPPATFWACADRRQAIYNFRGARPDLMDVKHPNAAIIDLKECFRCGDRIGHAANRLIDHNGDSLAVPMVGATGREGVVEPHSTTMTDLPALIADLRCNQRFGWGDIAILARRHATLRALEWEMVECDIPVHRVGKAFDICESEAFLAFHAALRLEANPKDDLACLRVWEFGGVPKSNRAEMRKEASEKREPLYKHDGTPSGSLIDVAHHWVITYPEHRHITDWWLHHCGLMTIADALTWFALRDSQDDHKRGDHVTLCTVHAAKGLEWPCVVVACMNEKEFPSAMSGKEEDGIREERRVAYVAITRAKERLVLHWRPDGDEYETMGRTQVARERSRFVGEATE